MILEIGSNLSGVLVWLVVAWGISRIAISIFRCGWST